MVNNAGVSGTMHRRFLDDDLADFHKVMAVNVAAVMAGTRDAARHMATTAADRSSTSPRSAASRPAAG